MQESMLFDVKAALDGDVVVLTATSAFDTGLTLRMTKEQANSLVDRLNVVLEPGVDIEALTKILTTGITQYIVNGVVKAESTWEPRDDWGGWRLEGWGQIADALAWECGSCRPDVGWPKWDTAIKAFDTNVITIHVECGHCGNTYSYNELGVEQDDD